MLLYKLIYGFCDLNIFDFMSFSSIIFKNEDTRGNALKIYTEHFSYDTCKDYTGTFPLMNLRKFRMSYLIQL